MDADSGPRFSTAEVALNNTAGISLTSSQADTSAAIDALLAVQDPYKQIPDLSANPACAEPVLWARRCRVLSAIACRLTSRGRR